VLKDSHGIDRIEHAAAKRQVAGIGRRKSHALIVRRGFLLRGEHFGKNEVDAEELDL
jgi:hypothetical protein